MGAVYNETKSAARAGVEAIAKLRGVIGLSALVLAGLGAIGAAKAFSPSAVADNADDFVLNETLKTSLAKARQDNEIIRRQKKSAELASKKSLPHDKFV